MNEMSHEISRLEGLQQMMLRWERFHPYNAVQIALFDQECPAAEVVVESVVSALAELGMDRASPASGLKGLICGQSGQGPSIDRLECGDLTESVQEAFIERELARPFSNEDSPFRFHLLQDGEGRSQGLAVTYRHAVSDAQGITLLMGRILEYCFGNPERRQWILRTATVQELFPDQAFRFHGFRRLAESLYQPYWFRNCERMPSRKDHSTLEAGCVILPTSLSAREVVSRARKLNCTVQELLFAATLESVARSLPVRHSGQEIAVNTLVDLRRFHPDLSGQVFGCFLGGMNVKHRCSGRLSFSGLLTDVRQQVRQSKKSFSFLNSCAAFESMARWWDCLPDCVNRRLGPWLLPLSAGISNVRLSAPWGELAARGLVSNYLRATSLGLMLPMMVTVTTCGDSVSLNATYRRSLFDRDEVEDHLWWIRHRLDDEARVSPVSRQSDRRAGVSAAGVPSQGSGAALPL